MARHGFRRTLFALCLAAMALTAAPARAEDATLFDEGRAQRAFAAIQDKIGHALRVVSLRITPDELSLGVPNDDRPGEVETWRVSRKGLAGALGLDLPRREGSSRASLPGGAIAESVIAIDAAGLAIVPKLAAAALARARLQQPGRVTEMEILRLPKFLGAAARDPYWEVHVEGVEEEADISAKLNGEVTIADLRRTKRAENLDLLAGGADFDEMIQNIRDQIKNDWIFHYIEIEKTEINFDVHLLSVKDPRITRFTATLSDIVTGAMSMPHMTFPGAPSDDPFNLADVDLNLLTKLEAAAKERLAIADGVAQRAIISKPHRERGGGVEWEVQIKSASAPMFWTPNSPPVEEGSVTFDAKGNVLRAKYPPGRGPRTSLFDPPSLQKAIDKIVERLGPHVQLTELAIDEASIKITAQDPKDSKKLAVFMYEDEDVSRAAEPLQMIANGVGAEPSWLWDVALIKPSIVQSLGALETQTMARSGGAQRRIEGIAITKDKTFYPANDKVLIEIRAAGEGTDSQQAAFDLGGAVAKLDAPRSGLFVGGASGSQQPSAQDDDDCTRSSDPQVVIPACTRLAEDKTDTPHNRAVAFFDRGVAYKNLKQNDRALADYTESLKLDPNYAHAYLNRALVYATLGDAAHALADGTKAIALDPKNPVALFNRGLVYQAQKNFDAAIADFSRAIALNPDDPNAYYDRGWDYYRKGDTRRAIADYDETIRRAPRFAAAYNLRGLAYGHAGDADRAIADYTQAIQLDGRLWAAHFNRGAAYYVAGALPKSLADLTQANALDPTQPYGALLLEIVAQRSGLASPLKEASAKIDMAAWPAPLIRLFMGQLTPEATLAAAEDPDPETKRGRVCEANFYTGVLDARAGRKDDAARRFSLAANDCPASFLERAFAGAELKTLGAPPAAKP